MSPIARVWFLYCVLSALTVAAVVGLSAPTATTANTTAREIPVAGPIGPANAEFVMHELNAAEQAHAPLVILRLDTPGGLSSSMRTIVKAILASPVPVVGFVGPSGARAASAGTYILYATGIAAMAPATNLGAATPVLIGPNGPATDDGHSSQNNENADQPDSSASAERRKIINDAVAYIRSLAERTGRNADWAEKAVRGGVSLSAKKAVDKHVVDLIAADNAALLEAIDGRTIKTAVGTKTLTTANLSVTPRQPGWRIHALQVLTNPSVALLLFVVGILGLVGEALIPGTFAPGVVGALSLLASLYAFHVLPVNYAGVGLIALGVGLVVAEAFVPSFGALGLGGLAAFVFGSLMLMDTPATAFQIAVPVIAVAGFAIVGVVVLIGVLFHHARAQHIQTAREGLIGSECVALTDFDGGGRVWLHGESWLAESAYPVARDDRLRVVSASGLTVTVEPLCHESNPPAEA